MTAPTPYRIRTAWRELSRTGPAPVLRIGLLASYTVDQLLPYLGVPLHEAGLPARFRVGPFDQIVRQCLDDRGETAAGEPDVLILAPRFEELGPAGPRWTTDLLAVADAARTAAERWAGTVVLVLPALPDEPDLGIGDAGSPTGSTALATRAREAVRARLAALPGVLVADAEDAVREVGAGQAHHPTMFRLAKVPYTEELFARLGARIARLLIGRFGAGVRAVALDADGLSGGAAAALRGPLRALRRAGTRVGLCATDEAVWPALAKECPELVAAVDAAVIGPGPIDERLAGVAAALDLPVRAVALVTTDAGLRPGASVLLGEQPDGWAGTLAAAGLFDRPAPPAVPPAPEPLGPEEPVAGSAAGSVAASGAGSAAVSLEGFVAGLQVVVDVRPVAGQLDAVAEVVARAKDFTLGNEQDAEDLAGYAGELLAVSVRDRFGDYGLSGAVGLRRADGVCTVDLFSLSCPVLGRRVEDEVLGEVVRRAEGADVVFRYRETGHNGAAVAFLRALPGTGGTGAGQSARLHALTWDAPAPAAGPAAAGVRFGVVALGESLPEACSVAELAPSYTADLDRIRGWGYRSFHRAPDGTGLTDLAVEAGERALAEAGVAAEEVDLVVLAVADLAEYLYWDPAAATQARLGARRAEAVLVNQACGGGVAAFDLVAGRFAVHPDYRTALLIGANRVCEPYWNRMEINTSVYSDGAAAAVLRRDHGGCRWLATETITDGDYADFMRMDVGGAAEPFRAGAAEQPGVRNPQDRLDDFFRGDVRAMYRFVSMIRSRGREVVDRACARAGVDRRDLRRVIHFNDNGRQLADLARDLGVPVERTNVESALDHGHIGCADQLVTLRRLLAAGELATGDLVALTSTSSGMHWVCTLLQV
ncbi:3-oxoacyl-[acyl-carrier-protein] synthase III C-terminal domain-containing protein [Kitasatospora sp. NPDC048538]|uniref:3-oxoacyl-[acyl-carrier-protein] synthase III C-terminal domain-containing protein n=1 Tax=unclassified Kitasatospora TaxID=2633591 RepID=UPI0033DEB525